MKITYITKCLLIAGLAPLFLMTGSVAAFSASGEFQNRSILNLRTVTVNQEDRDKGWINSKLNGFSIEQINTILANNVAGTYIDVNISDHGSSQEYVKDNGSCDSKIRYNTSNSQYELVEPKAVIQGTGECIEVITFDTQLNGFLDQANKDIWFEWTSENSMVRVDGREGNFIQGEIEKNKYFRADEAGEKHRDFVLVASDNRSGTYERRKLAGDSFDKVAIEASENVGIGNLDARNNPAVGADGSGSTQPSCESEGGEMSWLICPFLRQMDNGVSYLDGQINGILYLPNGYFEGATGEKLQDSWRIFRNLAYIILIPIMLVMVIGTALGFEFISAYTVKKALPRLIIAIFFITLSWPITLFLVEITNVLGRGIGGLIASPFGGLDSITLNSLFNPEGVSSGTIFIGFVVGAAAVVSIVSIGVILSYALVTALGLLVGFTLLAARQFVIVALMLLAPVAILSWIFKGNDKIWNAWWGSFSKLLLLYPLIMILIAGGRVFAVIVNETNAGTNTGGPDGFAATLIKLVAYVGPFFFIPAVFKFAGGVFATVAGAAQDKERGLFDRQKKYRGAKMGENWQKTRNYGRFSDRNMVTRGLNKALGAGVNPRDVAKGRAGILAGQQTGRVMQGAGVFENDATVKANQNDDNFLLALANEDLANQKLDQAKSDYNQARQNGDSEGMLKAQSEIDARTRGLNAANRVTSRKSNATRQAALTKLAQTGYQFDDKEEGYKQLADTVYSITKGDTGAYSALMDESQFHLKNAGRFDLGGINHGAGYDPEVGLSKVDPYTMASRAKPGTIKAKGELMRSYVQRANNAAQIGDAQGYRDAMHQAEIHRQELATGWDAATGSNKKAFLAELEDNSSGALGDLNAWANVNTGETRKVRENYVAGAAGWNDDDRRRGWRTVEKPVTQADVARSQARGARRPNPAELEENS